MPKTGASFQLTHARRCDLARWLCRLVAVTMAAVQCATGVSEVLGFGGDRNEHRL